MDELSSELEEYLYFCQYQKKLNDKTISAYRTDITQYIMFLKSKLSLAPDKNDVKEYFVFLHQHFKQKSVKRKIASVKAFYTYLEDEGKISENPMHKVKTKFKEEVVLPKVIPFNVIQLLLNYMYRKKEQYKMTNAEQKLLIRDIVIVELLFSTGIRISELCNIKENFINLEEGTLKIFGKGSKERYLQIENKEVLDLLKFYKDAFKEEIRGSGYFIVNRYGNRMSEQATRLMICRYAKQAGIEAHLTPHMFRHTFATLLLEEDVDIRYIQKMLGHSSILTTQIYTNVAMNKQREIFKTKHPRNRMFLKN